MVENKRPADKTKQWETHQLTFKAVTRSDWGIEKGLLPAVIKLLGEPDESKADAELSFKQFRVLVDLLVANKRDLSDLNKAITDEINRNQVQNVPVELIRALQRVLRTFFPSYDPTPYVNIPVDGIWGRNSESALNTVREAFHIAEKGMSNELLEVLQSVSG